LLPVLIVPLILASCAGSWNQGKPLELAAVPQRYVDGCTPPAKIALVTGVNAPKVNEGRLAVAYGKCARLQLDTANWTQSYLKGLAGK
jgi:hypothetical protein